MTIKCSLCGMGIQSLDIDRDRAIRELGNNLTNHLVTNHREKVLELQKSTTYTTAQIIWFMLFTIAAKVPEDETYLLDKIEKSRAELAGIIGVEIVGDKNDCEIVDVTEENKTNDKKPLVS